MSKKKITKEQVAEIRKGYDERLDVRTIAKRANCSTGKVSDEIKKYKQEKEIEKKEVETKYHEVVLPDREQNLAKQQQEVNDALETVEKKLEILQKFALTFTEKLGRSINLNELPDIYKLEAFIRITEILNK